MDTKTAHETVRILGVTMGEIMEDHVDIALLKDLRQPLWTDKLAVAGEQIVTLAAAIRIIAARSGLTEVEGI